MNKMNIAILASILMFLLSFSNTPSFSAEPVLGGGRISLVQGQVLIQAKDDGDWTEASANFPIVDGDRIMTERDGRIELNFKNGTYVRVGEESQLDIIALDFSRGKSLIHLNQLEGKIYVNHRPTTEEASSLYLDLPYGVISAFVPARFRVDMTPSEARISVLEGSVELMRDKRPITLIQGKTLIAREDGNTVGQLYERDEWEAWNEARDNELLQRAYGQKHLPPELQPYGYEMEGYGQWVYTPEYQYVWIPTVIIGWTPFSYGYWTWRGGIYCWVPYDPWGWIPFHYGRWAHLHRHGWVWVPPFRHAPIWHPGAVGWHIGPTHVSWIPLAPGEIYYGHRYYGPHSVNMTRVNVNIQKNIYINARIKNAVVTVDKASFSKRHLVKTTKMENPFLNPVKVSGPPTEKPISIDGKRTPSRLTKESVQRPRLEGKSLTKEWGRGTSSMERNTKVIEKGRNTDPQRKMTDETFRNGSERTKRINRQTISSRENSVRRDSPPISKSERVRGENQISNRKDITNRHTPVAPSHTIKTPSGEERRYFHKGSERSGVREVPQDRNRFERKSLPNATQSPYSHRGGKAFTGRPSMPEAKISPAPGSRGQVIRHYQGSRGGFPGDSLKGSFR